MPSDCMPSSSPLRTKSRACLRLRIDLEVMPTRRRKSSTVRLTVIKKTMRVRMKFYVWVSNSRQPCETPHLKLASLQYTSFIGTLFYPTDKERAVSGPSKWHQHAFQEHSGGLCGQLYQSRPQVKTEPEQPIFITRSTRCVVLYANQHYDCLCTLVDTASKSMPF